MFEDDEDTLFKSLYEDGQWEWDTQHQILVFVSNTSLASIGDTIYPTTVGFLDFKDDLDFNLQQLFIKHYQRKTGEHDVVTLQDVKDVALFTAPSVILSPSLINVLHFEITERFLRALILYCQYYLQVSEEMCRRLCPANSKIRTHRSDIIEAEFRDNLNDLRLLVAKEYYDIILGIGEFSKYHHMGANKRMRSLLKTDSFLFETLLRISIQIIWLALGRKSFNQIAFEIHRIFKSPQFNVIDHEISRRNLLQMSRQERHILLGHCIRQDKKLNTRSPLVDEMMCPRDIDYRLLSLGVAHYSCLPSRLRYFESILTLPEKEFASLEIALGIIGLPRQHFDTVLKEIKVTKTLDSLTRIKGSSTRLSLNKMSPSSSKSLTNVTPEKLYKNVSIPKKENLSKLPDRFHDGLIRHTQNKVLTNQKIKWLKRVSKISRSNNC